jgi:transcriptional regulator with XRE-family HTH domain
MSRPPNTKGTRKWQTSGPREDPGMNDVTIGRAVRAIRLKRGLRQRDVAERAGVSQQLVSELEAGRLGGMRHRVFRQILGALDADAFVVVRWRGGDLDRLLDEGHAEIVGRVCDLLRAQGWTVFPEVSFSQYGERGSIDVLAWHAPTRTLLVVEVKTEIASAEELLRRHDAKARLATKIARERFGLDATRVARLLVVTDSTTNRRHVARLDNVLESAYPERGSTVRRWLAKPA